MREINFKNCIKYISLVKRLVGNDWLSKEFEKINSYKPPKKKGKLSFIDYFEKFHPLAYLIYKVDKQLRSYIENKFPEVSEQICRLSYLGENLHVLKKQNVKGLDKKIKDLTSSGKEIFDKTTYEIEVGAAYIKKRYRIEFLETKSDDGVKTTDILIDFKNGIEVECKKKDRKSARDIRNTKLWKLIVRKASGMMEHFALNYAVIIKIQKDLLEQDKEFILKQLQEFIKEKKEGRFVFKNKGIGITLQILSDKDKEMESSGIEFGTSEELDYEVLSMESKKEKYGKVFIRNPRFFGFKSSVLPERISSVINSIKDAKQQLSGNRPGLIYVNLNMIDRKMMEKDFERLYRLIKNLLKNNSTITGVIITTEFFYRKDKQIFLKHPAKVIRNEQATHPLPLNFRIRGESYD